MNRKQKIWTALCLAWFLISEILWGPILAFIAEHLKLPPPYFFNDQFFYDHRLYLCLIMLVEIFCLVVLVKNLKFLIIRVIGIIFILFLFFQLWLIYAFRNGIGF